MDAFTKDGVVKDVIDAQPSKQLKLVYDGKEIQPGVTMTPTMVQNPPQVSFDADAGSFYTLIMHDPDAPSRQDPKFGEWQHWLVVNIPGGELAKGEVKSDYVGAGPPKDTGLHRYIFIIYKQSGKLAFDGLPTLTNRSPDGRAKQNVREFCKKYGLTEIVAGNFFQAEYDDYVPKLYEQLGA